MLENVLKIMGSANESEEVIEEISMTDKIKFKREALTQYMLTQKAQDGSFENIINQYGDEVTYTVQEALDWASLNPATYMEYEKSFNYDHQLYYNRKIAPYILKDCKNNNPLNVIYSKKAYNYINNPYFQFGITNKQFNEIWKSLRRKYPNLKEDDKDICAKLFPIEELEYEIGYNSDQKKLKVEKNDPNVPQLDLSKPITKGDLYRYWYNLTQLHAIPFEIFGNITAEVINDNLNDLKVIFVKVVPNQNDYQNRILFSSNSNELNIIANIVNNNALLTKHFIGINICNNINKLNDCIVKIFDKVLSVLPNNAIIIPMDNDTYKLFGINDYNNFYKYNKNPIICIYNNENGFECLSNALKTGKVSVKRTNVIKTDMILNKTIIPEIIAPKIETFNNITIQDINPNTFQYNANKIYSFDELAIELQSMSKYNIVYCSRAITTNKRNISDKYGKSYVILRNGNDKRFYFVEPEIMVGYSLYPDAKAEEPLERLVVEPKVKYSNIYTYKKSIEDKYPNHHISFYNTDFQQSIYIESFIRNRLNYEEGLNSPRIAVLDFETETEAITVKYDSETINAKCRLISLFDLQDKVFYCAVLNDPVYHKNNGNKDNIIDNITEHDGYKVLMERFDDERELWKWLNQKLYDIDPDIITGWNVERFDLTYAIVRCKTLGLTFKNKYGNFTFINTGTVNGTNNMGVAVDGMVIMDYQKLYRACQQNKRENYKLDYICNIELKKGKRQLVIDSHDEMYFNHLREYVLYNLEDVERIMELENKLNYLKFQFEMCNVCNISWDDIFAKTRLIDGLVYNHAWDINKTLLKSRSNAAADNLKLRMVNALRDYIIDTGNEYIGDISIRDYISTVVINEDDKGYEGAVVLNPQKGVKEIVADLDASQMYPRLMIRSNIFKDTLCAVIAIDNENYAEQWLYNRKKFPKQILIQTQNDGRNEMIVMTKEEFNEYLKDKILTPFGTIYWKPEVKRSLVSDILKSLIANRGKYKALRNEVTEKYSELKNKEQLTSEEYEKSIEYSKLIERYDNLQTAYKQLINSFYGVMGLAIYRLADAYSAASITASGRELTRMVAYYTSKFMDAMIKYKDENIEFNKAPIDQTTLIGMEDIENRINILYGDTDSIFVHIGKIVDAIYGKDIPVDEKLDHAWIIIDKLADYVNQYVIKDVLERKGINFNDSDSAYNYEYKKELIMSKILFGEQKKQYAMHLAIKEGKKLDKIDIKGMGAIKSDNSRFSRELATDIIEYMLKDYDTNDITKSNKILLEKYNTACKDVENLCKTGSLEIGRPVSITQDISKYRAMQSGVRGMMIYDTFFNHEFQTRDKGYQYYITEINWQEFGITQMQFMDKFYKKYNRYAWYNTVLGDDIPGYDKVAKKMTKELFFSSITIPIDLDIFPVKYFTIDTEKTIKTIIKEKVKSLLNLVGINRLDAEDDAKLKRTGILKFDVASLLKEVDI